MKILFLLQDVPFPLVDGMRWKMFYLLDFISKKHECDVIAFADNCDIERLKNELPNVNWIAIVPTVRGLDFLGKAFLNFLRMRPVSFARYQQFGFSQKLSLALSGKQYDVIHYDIINMAQFHRSAMASVHSPNDSASLSYMLMSKISNNFFVKMKMFYSAIIFLRYEKKYYPRFNKIHVVSKNDEKYLSRVVPDAHVVSIPFGVPASRFEETQYALSCQEKFSILLLGSAGSPGTSKGIELFVKLAVPTLLTNVPKIRIRVQGRGVVDLINQIDFKLAKLIEASDWVEDLDALIKASSIVVLPDVSGTGIKTRALESLACGAVVVGSHAAFDGISEIVESDRDCVIVNNHSEFSGEILKLFLDKPKRDRISVAARTVAKKYLCWDVLGPVYEKLYQDLAQSKEK